MHRFAAQRLDAGHEYRIHGGVLAQRADFRREPLMTSLDILFVSLVKPIDDDLQGHGLAGKAPAISEAIDHCCTFGLQSLELLEVSKPLLVECRQLCHGQPAKGVSLLLQGLMEKVTVGFFTSEDIEDGCGG
jgi:hypothetical protein